ncbi:VOC family protein [Streptomyces sp. NPDC048332]|uniref:VOC family protein n=1 Tax=unclassified Streptomyces TaxID=2593676 RepID=UPI003412BC6D
MLTTRFVDGAPNWMDLGTPDLEGAVAFYTALLGWEYEAGGPETGGYGMFLLDGKTVGGAMTVTEEQAKPSWSVYFRSADVTATAQAVRDAGGAVPFEPMDVLEYGRMGGFTDRAGAYFGVWQPKRNPGLGLVSEPGSLCWAELYTPDVPAAAAFYDAVFGWDTTQTPYPGGGGAYTVIRTAGGGEETSFGGLVPLDAVPVRAAAGPHWLPYIEVEDCDGAARAVEQLGGKLTLEPTEMEGVGTFANVEDPYGAAFAVIRGVQ